MLSGYRTLLRLIHRLPAARRAEALQQARQELQQRKLEANPETRLQYYKELSARVGFLRATTPKQLGDVVAGTWVLREGQLVAGSGEAKGSRCGA